MLAIEKYCVDHLSVSVETRAGERGHAQYEIYRNAKDNRQHHVDPEQHMSDIAKPGADLAHTILDYVGQYDSERYYRRRDKK